MHITYKELPMLFSRKKRGFCCYLTVGVIIVMKLNRSLQTGNLIMHGENISKLNEKYVVLEDSVKKNTV